MAMGGTRYYIALCGRLDTRVGRKIEHVILVLPVIQQCAATFLFAFFVPLENRFGKVDRVMNRMFSGIM